MTSEAIRAGLVAFAVLAAGGGAAAAASATDYVLSLDGLDAPGKTMVEIVAQRLKGVGYTVDSAGPAAMTLHTSKIGYGLLLGERRITKVTRIEGDGLPDPTDRALRTAYTFRLTTAGRKPIRAGRLVPAFRSVTLLGRRSAHGHQGANAGLPRAGVEFVALDDAGAEIGSTVVEDPRLLRFEPATSAGRHLISRHFLKPSVVTTVTIPGGPAVRRIEIRYRRGPNTQPRLLGAVTLP